MSTKNKRRLFFLSFFTLQVSEERKARSKEERKAEKEANEAIQAEYGIAIIDGHEEKIGNFRIEPPGLFRGRGEHPKQVGLFFFSFHRIKYIQ
jgi:DNA topoisomerase IB